MRADTGGEMKVEVDVPDGKYCTGCPMTHIMPGTGTNMWTYGCTLLHNICEADGDYQTRARKHNKCPALQRKEGR